jgi:hypothetical protein
VIIERKFQNIKCDHCGALLDEEMWCDDPDALRGILSECGWIECDGGRHYCDECWRHDDDDNIVTDDGRKWDDYDHKEILSEEQRYGLDYLKDLLDPRLTITQIRMEIIKAGHLYHSMVTPAFKRSLHDEIESALHLLHDRRESASDSEKDAYDTFAGYCIFYHLIRDGFPNNGEDVNIY